MTQKQPPRHLLIIFSLVTLSYRVSAEELSLSFGGDFGLSASRNEAYPDFANKHGKLHDLETLVSGIRPLWDADINFANMEAVVTAKPLKASGKKYVFKTHPGALTKLSSFGLNLYSTANNHSYDYNEEGVIETFENMKELEKNGFCQSAGVGRNLEEALSVKVFSIKGYTIAFAAIGILSENNPQHRAGGKKAGTASYRKMDSSTRSGEDYDLLLEKMRLTRADLKILSVHFGTEGKTALDPGQREDFHKAMIQGDVDVVLGHHAHVVRPWEVVTYEGRSRVIFYGLGNYLHRGTAVADYGLYGKLFFSSNANGRLEPQALKLVALTQTNLGAKPHSPSGHKSRMDKLNANNVLHFGAEAATAETPADASFSRYCWGTAQGLGAQSLCL